MHLLLLFILGAYWFAGRDPAQRRQVLAGAILAAGVAEVATAVKDEESAYPCRSLILIIGPASSPEAGWEAEDFAGF